jgi:sterol desaturase/sphingolipid hydroxylase (fatty acid hydroxylase superfamily)
MPGQQQGWRRLSDRLFAHSTGVPSFSPAERPQYVVRDGAFVGHDGHATLQPRRSAFNLKISVAVMWLLPFAALLLASATGGTTRSLSLQYLQALTASLLITAAFALLEKVLPAAGPRKPAAQIALNIRVGILVFLGITLTGALAGLLASAVGRHLGLGWIDLSFRSGANLLAFAVTVLLTWLIYDFFYYWYHRTQHTYALLWQIHKFHHMDEQVSVTTRFRDNLSDLFLSIVFVSTPIAILFKLDPLATAKLSLFMKLGSEAIGVFIHSNLRLHLGWASTLMVGPQLHRIHHSRLIQHHNRNFCVYFPVWDILFGTYHHPSRTEFPPTGIDGETDVSSVREVLALPFKGCWAIFCDWRRRHT